MQIASIIDLVPLTNNIFYNYFIIQRLQKKETKQFSGSEKQSSNEIVQYESIYVFVPNLNHLMQCRFLNNLAN